MESQASLVNLLPDETESSPANQKALAQAGAAAECAAMAH